MSDIPDGQARARFLVRFASSMFLAMAIFAWYDERSQSTLAFILITVFALSHIVFVPRAQTERVSYWMGAAALVASCPLRFLPGMKDLAYICVAVGLTWVGNAAILKGAQSKIDGR